MGCNSRAEGHLREQKGDAAVLGAPQGKEANRIDVFGGTQVNF